MNKKLLVLGIGPAQVDLIEAAKEMGMTVVACASNPNGPGRTLVDDFKEIDIKNIDEVRGYALEKEVDFIYSMALESAISTIVTVSNQLKLASFVSVDTLKKLNNKAQWRKELGNIKGNVEWFSGTKLEEFRNWDIYPAILKPVDASGQRGVYRVNDYEEVASVFEDSIYHSKTKNLIIERYINGPEISVNSIMHQGELKIAIISDRISYNEYPGGIIKEHHVPSRIIDSYIEIVILELVEKVNQAMGILNGHVYFQLKLDKHGPQIIEFTPRFDGCHMWRLIYESIGLDLRKVVLELLAVGDSKQLHDYNQNSNCKKVKTLFISDKPGTIVNKNKYEVPKNPLYLEWYYNNCDIVKKTTGYFEKIGYLIILE